MANSIYKVLGYSFGSFSDRSTGRQVEFMKVCIGEPITFPEGSNAKYAGFKSQNRRLSSINLLAGVEVGDWVQAFFDNAEDDQKRKVAFMRKLSYAELSEFGIDPESYVF